MALRIVRLPDTRASEKPPRRPGVYSGILAVSMTIVNDISTVSNYCTKERRSSGFQMACDALPGDCSVTATC
jgi:hypothetical protein